MKVVPKTALRIAVAPTGHFLKTWFLNYRPPLPWFCLPWWSTRMFGAHQGHVLPVPKVFAEIQAVSKQRGGHHSLSSWLVAGTSLTFVSSHSVMFSKKCWLYLFPNWKCIFKAFHSGKWETSICFGHSGDELPVFAYLLSEAFFATIRFYCYPILIQGQN